MGRNSIALIVVISINTFFQAGVAPTAAAQEGPQAPPPFEQIYQMPVVYGVPGMDKVQVRTDIVYKAVETPTGRVDLKFDLYEPANARKGRRFPAVMLISGGGIEGGNHDWRDAGVYKSYGHLLAASGFAGIAFSKRYSRGPEGTLNGIEDLHDLVGYVRQHATELSVDKDRLGFWAFSAGGFLLGPALGEGVPYSRAVICFYCISDIDPDTWTGLDGVTDENRDRARATASSVEQLRKGGHRFPPIFIARAGWDSPGLNQSIDRFIAVALARNALVEIMNHPTGRHGFDIIDPNDRSREIIRRTLDFLQTSLVDR